MPAVATAVIVGATVAAVGGIIKAVPAFIPNKERREELEQKKKEAEEGLSKEEEKELHALLSAGQAGMTKAAVDSIQASMAGAGMLSPGSALLMEKTLIESTQKAAANTAQQVAAADEAAKQAAEQRRQELQAQEDAWKENRRTAGFNLAGDVATAAGTGMMAGGMTPEGKPASAAKYDWDHPRRTGPLWKPGITRYIKPISNATTEV